MHVTLRQFPISAAASVVPIRFLAALSDTKLPLLDGRCASLVSPRHRVVVPPSKFSRSTEPPRASLQVKA